MAKVIGYLGCGDASIDASILSVTVLGDCCLSLSRVHSPHAPFNAELAHPRQPFTKCPSPLAPQQSLTPHNH